MKIAKTYRFDPIVLQKFDELLDYYAQDILQHPGQNRRPSATAMIQYLIIKEHAETVLKEEKQ